ncbi:hypothetical protein QFZ77_000157 [Paenibacillus sp. V4I3]|uniref:DUF4129 domain-containing protein n=1 Tax=unclassified Paenibacillus TaxID=185978 RepID=UPI00278AC606|nr:MULTISPECIES: DUF4129 domain-containing protein [unclassified Paenibacillus]MDQ0871498.1 hypothetical protein [Paenibacillus sp. V4I3]MDQ0885191.1 hypothetical protein [Paenibacillus sp. V4I9]
MLTPIQTPSQRANLNFLVREFCLTILYSLLELIIFFPIIVLIQVYVSETLLWMTCLQFLLCYVFGCFFGRIKWLTRTLYELMLCAGASLTIAYLLQGNNWHGWTCAAIGLILAYRGIRCTKDGWLSLFPASIFVTAGLVYFVGVPIMGRLALFHPYIGWMNGFGFCSLVIFFLATNRAQLLSATLAGNERAAASSLSESVKRSSRIWLITLIACIAAVAYFQQLQKGIGTLFRASIAWLLRLFQSEPSSDKLPEPSPAAQPQPFPPPALRGEPSWFDMLLHYAQVIFGYLIVIALILCAIYIIIAKLTPALVSLIRRLMNRSFSSKKGEGTEGFTDEKENLLAWKELPRMWWQQTMKSWSRGKANEPKWSHLSNNQERIRFLYRVLIQQATEAGYTYNKAHTPNETEQELSNQYQLSNQAVHAITSAYNQARYRDDVVSDLELDQVLQTLDPLIRNQLK